jgi:hypothetical protein
MPENHPPLETAEDVFRQSGEERLHAAKLESMDCLSQFSDNIHFVRIKIRSLRAKILLPSQIFQCVC